MPNSATRLITLILLLQRQPNQKAAGLAAALGVSVRTLHRYLGMLEEMGIPVYSERGPYGGFSLVRGYRMPPLVFTPEEAVAVTLGAGLVSQMWGRLYAEAAAGALAKLENVLPDEQRSEAAWAQRALAATGMHRSDLSPYLPLLEKLRRAVRELRSVGMRYLGGAGEAQARQIDPYALVYQAGWWYVVGFCHLRQALRQFRVDRILELTLSEHGFQIPADFEVHRYMEAHPQNQPQVQARLRFNAQGAQIAQANRLLWAALEPLPDGEVEVILNAPDLNWAASMALSFGSLARVTAPPELQALVLEWATAITHQYQPEQTTLS